MQNDKPEKANSMLSECMRQIFEAEQGSELVGASRLARALAERDAPTFDALVVAHQQRRRVGKKRLSRR